MYHNNQNKLIMAVENKTIKWGVYTSPQTKEKDLEFEMYIIEGNKDLKAFRKAFPQIRVFGMYATMQELLNEGRTIVANDPHWLTGMPTYCFESPKGSTHPSSFIRVRKGKIQKKVENNLVS